MLAPWKCDQRVRSWTRWRRWLHAHRSFLCQFVLINAVCLATLKGWQSYQLYNRDLRWNLPPMLSQGLHAFTLSLWRETQRFDPESPRGIVLPLYDDIAYLGISLILELRRLQVPLPIEIPHCGDLRLEFQHEILMHDPDVTFYDVCERAANASAIDRPLFCADLRQCHSKFRDFNIKVLALVYSKFQEIMLLDADTLFFKSPMPLWDSYKYKATGTLFFNDRVSYERSYLAERRPLPNGTIVESIGAIHQFLTNFDVTPYQQFKTLHSQPQVVSKDMRGMMNFSFHPSAFLLSSHVWHLRSGHQMDSSLLLWNKIRQPRATTILASFISLNGLPKVPSYGDKELYWLACELAETAYAFSDYGTGTIGWEIQENSRHEDNVLCGDALQYYPEPIYFTSHVEKKEGTLLYMNSDNIVEWGRSLRRMYRTAAYRGDLYFGSFTERGLKHNCPFDMALVNVTPSEAARLEERQQLYDIVVAGA
ncbi:hypothetical protein CCR75_005207 [Bremia lactucae]|uniref:Nucleotide-diphospho-sugar transferase domain-containing protein n=1 Tax=Bremia lactucae TaxID=4779 RepID=A0A976IM57_BRELC|nr:hypothetical protein CCR75_005207 [Bremia lactucae]